MGLNLSLAVQVTTAYWLTNLLKISVYTGISDTSAF